MLGHAAVGPLFTPILVGLMVLVASYSDPRSSPQRRFFSLGVGVAARHTRAHVDVRRQAPCVVAGCGIGGLGDTSGRAGEAGSSFRWELGRYDRTVLTLGLSFWLCLHNTHTHMPSHTHHTHPHGGGGPRSFGPADASEGA